MRNEIVATVGQRLGFMSADDVYNTLGYGGISLSKLSGKLHDEFAKTMALQEKEATPAPVTAEQIKTVTTPKNLKTNGGIVVDGEHGCQVKFARCCNPLPGDEVIGFVTKGYGISIHKIDCPNVTANRDKEEYKDRWVEAHWEGTSDNGSGGMYEAQIRVYVTDRMGIVADISVALSDMRVYLLQINTVKSSGDTSIINLKISCKNVDHYRSIVSRLKSIDGVLDVSRGFS